MVLRLLLRQHRIFHSSFASNSSIWRIVIDPPAPNRATEGREDEYRRIMEATIARDAEGAVQLLMDHFKAIAKIGVAELASRKGN
jgi:DNA-binding GntR family transcriptional regulator